MRRKVSINYLKTGAVRATVFDRNRLQLAILDVSCDEHTGYDFDEVYRKGLEIPGAYGVTCNYYVRGEVSSSIYLNFY